MKKFALKGFYVSTALVIIAILNLSFAFSNIKRTEVIPAATAIVPLAGEAINIKSTSMLEALYDSLQLDELGLNADAFNYAIKGFENLKKAGKLNNERVLSIIDFTKPSS